jgi:hypothetical protein
MESPRRPEAHVIETASWRLLQSLAPEEWIVREVSERDYGIDAYIELLSRDREITGDLMSVQLKGQKWINWTESDGRDRVARSPAVKTATASYWHRFPVPVFLFVADLATKNIYFAPLQEHIRKGFGRLCTQQSVTFPLYDGHDLKSKSGLRLLRYLYDRERMHDHFVFHITNLINQVEVFGDFIQMNLHRDPFLYVKADRHLQFRALHEACQMASIYPNQEWTVPPLGELYRTDREEWDDSSTYLHEKTLSSALQVMEKAFPVLVRKAIKLVADSEASYWQHHDPVFFKICSSDELDCTLNRIESEACC